MPVPKFNLKPPLPPRLLEQVIAEIRAGMRDGGASPTAAVYRDELAGFPIYETSEPTGPRPGFRWLGRHPDPAQAHNPNRPLFLYEVIPFDHPDGGLWIYHWRLEVVERPKAQIHE